MLKQVQHEGRVKNNIIKYWKPLAAVVFWGISFIATKIALVELVPLTLILLRLILAVIFLTAIAVYTKRDFSINLKSHGGISILALIAVLHLWIQVTGSKIYKRCKYRMDYRNYSCFYGSDWTFYFQRSIDLY